MKQRNILMCLQQLDIGGVETAVLTLCKGYKRVGYNVYVAAKNGIYSKELHNIGVEILPIEYKIENKYALDEMNKLISFCKQKKITEIHIHQYPCVAYWLPVIMKLKIPYVAYVHSIIPGAPEWFMKTFSIYRTALPIFFNNASKIVCITEKTKNDIEKLFNLGDDKYLIIPNSLNMQDFITTKKITSIKIFGIVSRLSEEKLESIKNSINIFEQYSKKHNDCRLLIAGDGPIYNTIYEMTKSNKNIEMIGTISEVSKFMENIDVYMGVDRTVLEAIACNRLVIISNYSGKSILLTIDNIDMASNENFSGNNLDEDINIIEKLEQIDKKEYKRITSENYAFINERYNVDNNLYNDILENNYSEEYNDLFKAINELAEENSNLKNELYGKKENILYRIKRNIVKLIKMLRKIFNK